MIKKNILLKGIIYFSFVLSSLLMSYVVYGLSSNEEKVMPMNIYFYPLGKKKVIIFCTHLKMEIVV